MSGKNVTLVKWYDTNSYRAFVEQLLLRRNTVYHVFGLSIVGQAEDICRCVIKYTLNYWFINHNETLFCVCQ